MEVEAAAEPESRGPSHAGPAAAPPASGRLLAWADRRRSWLFALTAVLYLASFNGRWRVSPDSALYMSLGRSLAEGNGFTYHGEPHNWGEPGLPWVIAASFRLFGQDNYWPLALLVLLCGFASLVLCYHLFKRHAGRPTAVVVTLLLAVCETFYRYAFHLFTDMPFQVGLFAVLLGYEWLVTGRPGSADDEAAGGDEADPADPARRQPAAHEAASPAGPVSTPAGPAPLWRASPPRLPVRPWAWAAVALGTLVMCAFRPTIITFLGALAVATAWHVLRGPHRLRHALIAAVVVACVVGFRLADPRGKAGKGANYREATLKSLITERPGFALRRMWERTIPETLSEHAPEAVLGVELGPVLDQAVSVLVIGAGVALATRRVLWGAWVAATVAQIMFWLPRERYFLPILPLLLFALWRGLVDLERRLKPPWRGVAFAGLLLLLTVPNFVQVTQFIRQQRYRGISATRQDDLEVKPLIEMGHVIGRRVGEGEIVLAESARQLSYFSRRRVEAPPRSLRFPPPPMEEHKIHEKFVAARALYAVLPDSQGQGRVRELIGLLGMELGPEVAAVDRGARNGLPPLTLYRLVPDNRVGNDGAPPGGARAGGGR